MLADSVLQGRYAEPEWSIHLILTSTMATKAKTAAKKATPKKAATAKKPAATAVSVKPLKDTFTKSSLVSHLAEQAQVDAKAVKAVLLHLEQWFEAKPATVRVKVRALKKVKDAALNG
jgi:hypothetical protein